LYIATKKECDILVCLDIKFRSVVEGGDGVKIFFFPFGLFSYFFSFSLN